MDRRCVYYRKPLLESGTLGTKGNVQVMIHHHACMLHYKCMLSEDMKIVCSRRLSTSNVFIRSNLMLQRLYSQCSLSAI